MIEKMKKDELCKHAVEIGLYPNVTKARAVAVELLRLEVLSAYAVGQSVKEEEEFIDPVPLCPPEDQPNYSPVRAELGLGPKVEKRSRVEDRLAQIRALPERNRHERRRKEALLRSVLH